MDGLPALLPHWTVLIGPGERLALIERLLDSLRAEEEPVRLLTLADLDLLLSRYGALGRALVDADALPIHDLGIVTRFLERRPGWDLVLTGDDPTARSTRTLLAYPNARWLPWPLDVEELESLLVAPEGFDDADVYGEIAAPDPFEPEPRSTGPPATGGGSDGPGPWSTGPDAGGDELETIESILGDDPPPDGAAAEAEADRRALELGGGMSLDPDELAAFLDTAADIDAPARQAPPRARDSANGPGLGLPPYYREQVADLADLAQNLHHGLARCTEEGGSDGRLVDLSADVSRLVQFARTLGYLVSPPGPGDLELELSILLEEQLGALAGSTDDSPRFLFRGARHLNVRSDKALLAQAFDAVLAVAEACAESDDVVRVSAGVEGPNARVDVLFPAGPLADLPPDEIVRPYALRRRLPQIGPNALAAAAGILRGQGGGLALAEGPPGSLAFTASLPLAP